MAYQRPSPPARRRLNDMLWCRCGHGKPAHTRGTYECNGGTKSGEGMCRCRVFVEQPPDPEPDA